MANKDEILIHLKKYHTAVAAQETAEVAVMSALEDLKAAAGGSTFIVDGQHYQIRKRSGKTYLCELAGPPKGRPKKVKAETEASTDVAESVTA